MRAHMCWVTMAVVGVAMVAAPAGAKILLPGSEIELEGETLFAPGTVIHDQLVPFTIPNPNPPYIPIVGVLQNRVVRVQDTNQLAFCYRIRDLGGAGTYTQLLTVDFSNRLTDVEWSLTSLGDVGAYAAVRSDDPGAAVSFLFQAAVPAESKFCMIKTDANHYVAGGVTYIFATFGYAVVPTVLPVYDDTPPEAEITSPVRLACVCDPTEVTGTAHDPDVGVESYVLEYAVNASGPWTEFAWGYGDVQDDTLGVWHPGSLAQGYYFLRLRVVNNVGLERTFTTFVWVDNGFDDLDLRSPTDGDVLGRQICIDGTSWDNLCFDYYTVEFAPPGQPFGPVDPDHPTYTSWVITDPLAIWNTQDPPVADGAYTIRVRAMTDCDYMDEELADVIVDNTSPMALISSPENCDDVEGSMSIYGSAYDDNMHSWSLRYTGGDSHGWMTIATGTGNVIDGLLGTWDVSSLPPCAYTLRLWVTDAAELDCSLHLHHHAEYTVSVTVGGGGVGCPGDCNYDGVVDFDDINPFISLLGTTCP